VPAGHPEGYLEAFAQLYRDFAQAWRGHGSADFPGLADGLEGMAFIEAVLRSHQQNAGWVRME
jgi:predicted dehydrogenase